MLTLSCINPQKQDNVSYSLCPERKYFVGRKQGDITFPNDSSISRTHAELEVIVDKNDPSSKPRLVLTDMGSKFGTFITSSTGSRDKEKLTPRAQVELSAGDEIRFGLQFNEFRIQYVPLVVTTSSFRPDEKFKNDVAKFGGFVVNDWQDNVTHVVMQSLSLTVKAVCALLSAKSIVTPAYISDLISSLTLNKGLPDPNNYLPPIAEKEISNLDEAVFYPNETRTTLFAGKTFLFCTPKHMKKLDATVKAGGGNARLVSSASQKDVIKDEFIIMANPLDLATVERNPAVKAILQSYKKTGKRYIADSEIGLAVVYNSIDKFCNPTRSVKDAVLPRLITTQSSQSSSITSSASVQLAPETQELFTQRSSVSSVKSNTSRKVINETVVKSDQSVDDDIEMIAEVASTSSKSMKNEKTDDLMRSGKKRTAGVSLSKPESKRFKEASPMPTASTSSRITRSSPKVDSSKALTSLFNLSDSDSDNEQEESKSVAANESKGSRADEMDSSDMQESQKSQHPAVKIVDIKRLQSSSTSQNSVIETRNADQNASIAASDMKAKNGNSRVPNLGTDDVQTVRASVMDAPTLPATTIPATVVKSLRNTNEPNQLDPEAGTSSGRKRRREQEDENEDTGDALSEKTRKITITEDKKVVPESTTGESFIPPPPLIRKPLYNPNLSRLESSLLSSNGSNCNGKKNFKSFKKVLPKFLGRPISSPDENSGNDSRINPRTANKNNLNVSVELRSRGNVSVKLVVRDYDPALPGCSPITAHISRDRVQPQPRELDFDEAGDDTSITSRNGGASRRNNSKLNGGVKQAEPQERTTRRTDAVAMPPPARPPLPVSIEDDDVDDMWSFK